MISNGGKVFNVGNVLLDTGDSNRVVVADACSVWNVTGSVILGQGNSRNFGSVIVSNGGVVNVSGSAHFEAVATLIAQPRLKSLPWHSIEGCLQPTHAVGTVKTLKTRQVHSGRRM